jgi:splicing factor 3B subunit 3
LNEIGRLNGAPYKFEPICNMYIGEVVCSMQKTNLVSTSNEVIIYATSMGGIGAFYPFETKEVRELFEGCGLFHAFGTLFETGTSIFGR